MLEFITNNIGTIVVFLILAGIIGTVIVVMARDRKKGKSSCGCGCSHCAMSGVCRNGKPIKQISDKF